MNYTYGIPPIKKYSPVLQYYRYGGTSTDCSRYGNIKYRIECVLPFLPAIFKWPKPHAQW